MSCPGMERVKGRQKSWPLVMFLRGKKGSFSGTGIGRHSGWMVRAASQRRQSRMLPEDNIVSCQRRSEADFCGSNTHKDTYRDVELTSTNGDRYREGARECRNVAAKKQTTALWKNTSEIAQGLPMSSQSNGT